MVIGAGADDVLALLPADVRAVRNDDFAAGMGGSLRRGLAALSADPGQDAADAALIMLVDLPDVGRPVVDRLLAAVGPPGDARRVLIRAGYRGRPGHPVVIGRDHWAGVQAAATGDAGARPYFREHPPRMVECGDLATGVDVDRPAP